MNVFINLPNRDTGNFYLDADSHEDLLFYRIRSQFHIVAQDNLGPDFRIFFYFKES